MMKTPSKKAEKTLTRLFTETKEHNEFCKKEQQKGRNDGWYVPDVWRFANMPIEGETLNMLKDMAALLESRKRHIESCRKLGIHSSISLVEYEIIKAHLQDRISTYAK